MKTLTINTSDYGEIEQIIDLISDMAYKALMTEGTERNTLLNIMALTTTLRTTLRENTKIGRQ